MITRFENAYVLDVLSNDHPGIVAAVSNAVEGIEGNIDACSQTVLAGYFTLIMVVSFPKEMPCKEIAARIEEQDSARGLQVLVRPYVDCRPAAAQKVERFVISAFGKDRPGIVRRFTQYLAGKDINIVDLFGDRRGDEFVMISEVEIPTRWEISMLQTDLEQLGKEEGFTVHLQHENVFVATNQLRLKR
jgi:glycine cleavage system transcriptional repressor